MDDIAVGVDSFNEKIQLHEKTLDCSRESGLKSFAHNCEFRGTENGKLGSTVTPRRVFSEAESLEKLPEKTRIPITVKMENASLLRTSFLEFYY